VSDLVFVRVVPGNTIHWPSGAWAQDGETFDLPRGEADTMVAKGWVELAERPEPPPAPPGLPTVTVALASETVEGHAGDIVDLAPDRAAWLRQIGAAEVVVRV
jgi:hypothetical protein